MHSHRSVAVLAGAVEPKWQLAAVFVQGPAACGTPIIAQQLILWL